MTLIWQARFLIYQRANSSLHLRNVRFLIKSGHLRRNRRCPLWVKSGHVQCNTSCLLCAKSRHRAIYSITSSAAKRMPFGIVMPSALAVLRLTTNSNLVGCSIGSSAGFAPFRIRAT